MPLTTKGRKALNNLKSELGAKKGEKSFLSKVEMGKIKGAVKGSIKRKVDSSLPYYGEAKIAQRTIVVNPKKGQLVNTIIHEELHHKHPNKTEKEIRKMANREEKQMGPKEQIELLKKYLRKGK